ncbi:glucose-6-phosphate dehydrogenase assembly protein OpcA [Corynebacterium choanae]|uniref:Glucose-6-phosphate dehydrogenase subunit n=1 Tax=Corynebacterium choanae TaxID=1862358 RepID=A0A3G6J9Q8_9CORY|nr:glucose-6-phosphate dehydrogenase assembly protein OpcA [Corynebacterium choanae]AZA13628.1 Glucose-6-phosphate dehydrogenase subunit [Corynebacterium choanae]
MIFSLANTTTQEVAKRLVTIREEHGQIAVGRVLTLIVVAHAGDDTTAIVEAVTEASREHPSRVILLLPDDEMDAEPTLDAEIRIGGHAGASEIVALTIHGAASDHLAAIVTPLLLPDTPIVAWWPNRAPANVAQDPIGQLAQRRITDSLHADQVHALTMRGEHYAPGDSDIAWSAATAWRGLVASTLDEPPHESITAIELTGPGNNPSVCLCAGWLADRIQAPVTRIGTDEPMVPTNDEGEELLPYTKLVFHRESSTITIRVVGPHTVEVANTATQRTSLVALSPRTLTDCIAEELRHLAPDDTYAHALRGLHRVNVDENHHEH